MTTLTLPRADGTLAPYTMRDATPWTLPAQRPAWNRVAFAAAHVVAISWHPIPPRRWTA